MKHESVQIVGVGKDGKHLEFNKEAFQQILVKNGNIEQLCVLSIAGEKRTGKSFLLSILLRFLTGMGKKDWMKKDIPLKEGFSWQGGYIGHTMGIWAWDEIFTYPPGSKTGIMLLDTQGTFDLDADALQTSHVFTLSTLISSIQVFNLKGSVSMNDLEHLQLFVSLANFAHQKKCEESFQSLVFLVRDWVNPRNCPFGKEGGERYLEYVKNPTKDGESKKSQKSELMEGIMESFQEVSCYLMPTPGPEMTEDPDFEHLSKIERVAFLQHLEKLATMLFAKPIAKKIGTQLVSLSDLGEYLKNYTALFIGDEFPEPRKVAEATAESYNKGVSDKAIAKYEGKMKKRCSQGSKYLKESQLRELHSRSRDKAMEFYNSKQKMTLPGQSDDDFEKTVYDRIELILKKYRLINNGNRGIWDKYGTRFLAVGAVAATSLIAAGSVVTAEMTTSAAMSYLWLVMPAALPIVFGTFLVSAVMASRYLAGSRGTANDNRTVPEARGWVAAARTWITRRWESFFPKFVLFLGFTILFHLFFYTIPFVRSTLVILVGELGVAILQFLIYSILRQLLPTLFGAAEQWLRERVHPHVHFN